MGWLGRERSSQSVVSLNIRLAGLLGPALGVIKKEEKKERKEKTKQGEMDPRQLMLSGCHYEA